MGRLYFILIWLVRILNWSVLIMLMIKFDLIMGLNILVVFFLVNCINVFFRCLVFIGLFVWIFCNSLGVNDGMFVILSVLFLVSVLLMCNWLWFGMLMMLLVYVFFVSLWLVVRNMIGLVIVMGFLVWMWVSFILCLKWLEVICIKVIWLWCLGFMLVWILNMKLVIFFLLVLIWCGFVDCGWGGGLYLVMFDINFWILNELMVELN